MSDADAFEHTGTVTSVAAPSAVWALWSDLTTWATWDPSVQEVRLDGELALGATGTMTLSGGIEVPLTIVVVEPGRRYLDRLTIGDLVIAIDHVVVADPAGCRVTVSTTIEGPGAHAIGPVVTQEAPTALARLVELAEGSV